MKTIEFNYNKIYLTGPTGWLGRNVLKTFLNGDQDVLKNFEWNGNSLTVLNLKDEQLKYKDKRLKIVEGDIRFLEDCKMFLKNSVEGILIHTAGIIHPRRIRDFYDINFVGTKNLIKIGISSGIKKFIIISSNSPIGCNKNPNEIFDEESAYNPYMNYGKSKMLMEKYLLEKIQQGVDITILRTPWFYGVGMPERQLQFYRMIRDGKVPIVGNGKNVRSKVNVKNIVQAIILASIKPISKGRIYWISDKKSYSMNEIIDIIRKVLENEFKILSSKNKIKVPYFLGQIAQGMDYLIQSLGFYNKKIHVLSEMNKNIICRIDKAKDELGYQPSIDLYEGTKKALIDIEL